MKAAAFDYLRASSVDEALEALSTAENAKVLAGGQSLVPLLNRRLARPSVLVDINGLDLSSIQRTNDHLVLGALTRHRAVETSPLVARDLPLLTEALRHVGHVAIRNRGTFGGSLAHADPAAELPAVAVALDAEFTVRGEHGLRTISARDFFTGSGQTALEADELLVEVRLPVLPARTGHAVEELSRRSHDLALVAVFVTVTLDADGACEQARIAIAGAGPTPIRAIAAEESLRGSVLTPALIAGAAREAAAATDPASDLHAPADYRRDMAAVLARRAITRANGSAR
ncbi:carbon-monoxide dehydrogenase medium subunit [Amycolatopsis xylanica]|uniref:Carbon-monoxide dehydrogenase medium subunit n=1 Tax=Amycolatopsis xylanica TaxID=589385 RepID=A0A1H3DFT9_9PSEU|nr:xanthine dehydrogenase family protein subunit M [Amycolatopsis xylanica]SDX65217.1 carbon-monoxide dehydrogenase medium subunit [Amycolatopsis xylanica]